MTTQWSLDTANMQAKFMNIEDDMRALHTTLSAADACVKNLDLRANENANNIATNQLAIASGGGGQREPAIMKGFVGPKLITVNAFDDKPKGTFTDWRDTMERVVNAVFPGLKAILEKFRQEKTKINEDVFDKAKQSVATRGVNVKWAYSTVNDELGVYLMTKLADKRKLLAETARAAEGLRCTDSSTSAMTKSERTPRHC